MNPPRRSVALFSVALVLSAPGAALADDEADKDQETGQIALENGDQIRWGIVLSAVRFRVSRRADQPGRVRDFQPDVSVFSGQFGFQVVWDPESVPFRVGLEGGGDFQLFSVGFQILGAIEDDNFEQSELSVSLSIGMLNNVLGVGVGIDLYRGVAIQGRDGEGTSTAYTGLLSWALATEGELTIENLMATLYLNVSGIAELITGAAQ